MFNCVVRSDSRVRAQRTCLVLAANVIQFPAGGANSTPPIPLSRGYFKAEKERAKEKGGKGKGRNGRDKRPPPFQNKFLVTAFYMSVSVCALISVSHRTVTEPWHWTVTCWEVSAEPVSQATCWQCLYYSETMTRRTLLTGCCRRTPSSTPCTCWRAYWRDSFSSLPVARSSGCRLLWASTWPLSRRTWRPPHHWHTWSASGPRSCPHTWSVLSCSSCCCRRRCSSSSCCCCCCCCSSSRSSSRWRLERHWYIWSASGPRSCPRTWSVVSSSSCRSSINSSCCNCWIVVVVVVVVVTVLLVVVCGVWHTWSACGRRSSSQLTVTSPSAYPARSSFAPSGASKWPSHMSPS